MIIKPRVLAKWNAKTKRYEPVRDAVAGHNLVLECTYPITETSHPLRWLDSPKEAE